jgi:phospholipase/carboxylesterase
MSQRSPHPQLPLVYLVRPPQVNSDEWPPLLIQLHGIGSNERDLFDFAELLDPRFLVLSVRAPLTVGPDSYAWFHVDFLPQGFAVNGEEFRASQEKLADFLDEAVNAYHANPERVYLMGFSQGCIMSLTLALSHPELVAGVAGMSGRLPPEAIPSFAPKDELAGLPLLVQHGTADGVIPIRFAREAQKVLADLPVDLTYHEYEMRHEVTPASLEEALAWLTARLNGPRRTV